jgi:hypothetical protein
MLRSPNFSSQVMTLDCRRVEVCVELKAAGVCTGINDSGGDDDIEDTEYEGK